jgi:glutamine cyclotransferase
MRRLTFLFLVLLIYSCSGCKPDKPKSTKGKVDCRMTLDKNKLINGDTIHFDISSKEQAIISKVFAIDGEIIEYKKDFEISGLTLGKHKLSSEATFADGKSCSKYLFIEVVSDFMPEQMGYEVLNSYPHDNMSYTQGLEFHNGLIYEGTGQYGFSYIHNYNLFDQKSVSRVDLSKDLFGEGITIFEDKIFQLTYRRQKALIYDLETFEKLKEYNYKGMGWGLCNDGQNLVMTNGSNELIYRDPYTFEIIKNMYVYDNISKVDSLNELEYVNGFIYAYIYQQNFIVKIDPKSGKVLERIDMTGILNPKDVTSRIDVLNGIAYHPERESFYVTGKFWPKLFEVKFVPKK